MGTAEKTLDATELLSSLKEISQRIDQFGVEDIHKPKMVSQLLKKSAKTLQSNIQLTANELVTRHTGNYHDHIAIGKEYAYYNVTAIRVFAEKPARHANLLEYGHKMPQGGKSTEFKVFQKGFDNAKDEIMQNIENTFIKELKKIVRW